MGLDFHENKNGKKEIEDINRVLQIKHWHR